MGERVGFGYGTASRIALYVALALGAVVAPVLLSALEPRFLANTYGKAHAKYELFGFTAASTLMLIAAVEIRRRAGRHWRELLPVVVPVLVSLPYLFLIAEYSRRTFDFGCVEYAADAIRRGENPYGKFPPYLYPPLTGQVMAAIYPVAENAAAALGLGTHRKSVWGLVFYGYQCAQLGLIVLAYFLCLRFAQRVGVETAWAHALVAVLLLVNNPLLRTLRNAQNNLWVLDLSLLAIVLAQRMPFVSGLSLAVAVHIKLYPLVLLLPLALARCWRAVGWAVLACAAILFVQTDFARDWTLWRQFPVVLEMFPREVAFRNNSLNSILTTVFTAVLGAPVERWYGAMRATVLAAQVAAGLWFLIRMFQRERAHRARAPGGGVPSTPLLFGHAADALGFGLLASPSAWEHHYVLGLPLVIWAVASRGRQWPWTVAAGALLMLAMPTFDLFPLSYHRFAGLLLLLAVTSPGRAGPPVEGDELTSNHSNSRGKFHVSRQSSTT